MRNGSKSKVDPNHHMGKHTGYELVDGVYHIAPSYTLAFAELNDRAEGVDMFMKTVTRYVAELNAEIQKENRRQWDRLCDDLGLDRNKRWEQFPDGTIREEPKTDNKMI